MGKALVVSKVFWINLILTILAVIDLLSTSPVVPPAYLPWLVVVAGVLNIVLRIWFTDSPITRLWK